MLTVSHLLRVVILKQACTHAGRHPWQRETIAPLHGFKFSSLCETEWPPPNSCGINFSTLWKSFSRFHWNHFNLVQLHDDTSLKNGLISNHWNGRSPLGGQKYKSTSFRTLRHRANFSRASKRRPMSNSRIPMATDTYVVSRPHLKDTFIAKENCSCSTKRSRIILKKQQQNHSNHSCSVLCPTDKFLFRVLTEQHIESTARRSIHTLTCEPNAKIHEEMKHSSRDLVFPFTNYAYYLLVIWSIPSNCHYYVNHWSRSLVLIKATDR